MGVDEKLRVENLFQRIVAEWLIAVQNGENVPYATAQVSKAIHQSGLKLVPADAVVVPREDLQAIRNVLDRQDLGHVWLNHPEKPERTPLTILQALLDEQEKP